MWHPPRLVWRVKLTRVDGAPFHELVLVDAITGGVALEFNQVETALNRVTSSAGGSGILPGTQLCDESQPLCTLGVNTDADQAHGYARGVYEFYRTHHNRDSFNNAGAIHQERAKCVAAQDD